MTASKISSLAAVASLLIFGSSLGLASEATQAKLQAQAKVSEADARTTALAKVPGGSVSSSEVEKEHGKLIWSFDIAQVGSKNITEVQVDAKTGKIVSSKTETPDKERQEAIAEKKGVRLAKPQPKETGRCRVGRIAGPLTLVGRENLLNAG
jgi:hypothetical protein